MFMEDLLDELVTGITSQDEAAFHQLYDLLADPLASFAYGMLNDRGAAEDAVQQAFLELAQAASTFEGDGRSLRAWLYKSVRFTCLDEYRRRSRRPEDPTEELPEQVTQPISDHPELEVAVKALPPRQQLLLSLRHVEGLSGEEIAEVTDSTRTAVYAALKRAEDALRREFTKAVESSDDPASISTKEAHRA